MPTNDDDRATLESAYLAHREAMKRWLIERKRAEPDVADEVVQTLYVTIRRCPLPKKEECIKKWLYNKATSLLKHSHRSDTRRVARQEKTSRGNRPATPEEVEAMRSLARKLFNARSELSTLERQVFRLRASGWKASHVAARLGCSKAAVESAHQRAKTKLRRVAHEHMRCRLMLPPWLALRSRWELSTWSAKGLASPWIVVGTLVALIGMFMLDQQSSKASERRVANGTSDDPSIVKRQTRSESEGALTDASTEGPKPIGGTSDILESREDIDTEKSKVKRSRRPKVSGMMSQDANSASTVPTATSNPSESSPAIQPEPADTKSQLGEEARMLGIVRRAIEESRWADAKEALDEYERRFPGERRMQKTFETHKRRVAARSP